MSKHSDSVERARACPSSSSSSEDDDYGVDRSRRRKRACEADSRQAKRSRKDGKVLEHLAKQVSEIQNFLSWNAYPPPGCWHPTDLSVPNEESAAAEPALPEETFESTLKFDFELATNLKEPAVANASAEHLKLLESLQHFKTENWTNVRYSEIQKSYNARPGFVDLEVNDELKQFEKPSSLSATDKSLGAITRAVIMQSDALKKGVSDLLQWTRDIDSVDNESLVTKIKEIFSGDFQKISLDCLQLVCGRRADIIEQRRDAFISLVKEKYLKASLKKIPPSCDYLFDKEPFVEFLKNNGGISKVFATPKTSFSAQEKRAASGSQAAQPGPSGYNYSQAGRSMAPLNTNRYPPPQGVRPFYPYAYNYEFPAYGNNERFFRPQFRPQSSASRQQAPANVRKSFGRSGPYTQHSATRGKGRGDRKY